ncbi:MAG: sulfate adenylyltransferase subunit CysD, partial [Actinomycetales bacterium]
MKSSPEILRALENESIEILRETAASFKNPVLLYSIGKDSSVLLHLARKAFFPAPIPFPMLHIDTKWKFREMISFRDEMAAKYGAKLLVHTNEDGIREGISPFTTGASEYTRIMKTVALRQALDKYGFDAAIGGSRRDEERSRAKERIFSVREAGHRWDPREQRPELWRTYNPKIRPDQTMRVFPISDWTEL